jgi:hypothetical protein
MLIAAALLASAGFAAQAAEMTLYETPGFGGRQLTLRGTMPDINSYGFNDRASSVSVRSGAWEVCTDADFRGYCATLMPGEYRALDPRFNNRISSAREVGPPVADANRPRFEPRGAIEVFGQPGFRGRTMVLDRDALDLAGTGFNDRISSMIVREGNWELCTDARYSGDCRVFGPGRYADLGAGLNNQVSSAHMVPDRYVRVPAPAAIVQLPPPAGVPAPRIVLFDSDNFRGRSLALSDDLADLRRSDFNDDTASVSVESGEWEVCTDSFFHGQCRVLSPGQYRQLDPSIRRRITSVRRAGTGAPVTRAGVPSIQLYEGINFDGRSFDVRRDEPTLDPYRFNERASSMIVNEGEWEVCTDPGYSGRCSVYRPGRYADLGRMNNSVSSIRRINR